jgi:hypothetical protein
LHCGDPTAWPILPLLDRMVTEGLVTLERLQIIAYRHGGSAT